MNNQVIKVGINGFGRIGRMVLRAYLNGLAESNNSSTVKIVAINNPLKKGQTVEHFIHMLKYDTVHGKMKETVSRTAKGFTVNHQDVTFHTEMDPSNIPWGDSQVDVVIDCTGVFKDMAGLSKHLHGTVKKVVMSAPGENLDGTFVIGVNEHEYDKTKHHIVSNASCTTNCLAPLIKVLDEAFGIEKGIVSTCHSVTADQRLVDGEHEDLRRARAASQNMILTKTGAAKAVGEVLPKFKGKLDGTAIRVPTLDVSLVDAKLIMKKNVTAKEVNQALRDAANTSLKGVLGVSDEELVSSDFIGDSRSSIVDSKYTKVMDGNLLQVMSWYDNEMGYSHRLLDLVKILL